MKQAVDLDLDLYSKSTAYEEDWKNTPEDQHFEPKNGGLAYDFPFQRGWFSGCMLVGGGVKDVPEPKIGFKT